MRLNLFIFSPAGGPMFEVWAPQEMQRRDAPENAGALVAEQADGFAPNLVVGHNRVSADMTLEASGRSAGDRCGGSFPGAELRAGRTVAGPRGRCASPPSPTSDEQGSGPLYQMTACLLAPSPDSNGERRSTGGQELAADERDLIYLTGTCTVDQMPTWDSAFVDAASSVWFG